MKNTIIVTLLGTVLGLFSCNAQPAPFKSVSAREFAEVIADTTVFVLDVRTAEEYAAGHIGNATNIDVLQDGFAKKAEARIPEGKTVAATEARKPRICYRASIRWWNSLRGGTAGMLNLGTESKSVK